MVVLRLLRERTVLARASERRQSLREVNERGQSRLEVATRQSESVRYRLHSKVDYHCHLEKQPGGFLPAPDHFEPYLRIMELKLCWITCHYAEVGEKRE